MRVGDSLGPWVLRREIGGGGIAAVFLAEHVTRKSSVVLKVLREEFAAQPETVEIFLGEPRAQKAVEHENTIEVEHLSAEGPRPYFVTELARGRTLAELLKRGPLELARALHIARQVATVLAHAHDVDVVHRNLKPANVFLVRHDGDPDFVKLLELGATRMQSEGDKPIPGTLIGTPAYMAPEQLRQTAGGTRVDMYSFGVMLFELVARRKPFLGEVADLVKQHLLVPAPRARTFAPTLPVTLDALIAQCLEKDPDARPPSMHEVALELAALEDVLGQRAIEDEGPGPSFAVPKNTSGYTTVPADATGAPPAAVVFEDDEPSFESVTGEHRAVRDRAIAQAARSVPAPAAPTQAPRAPEPLWKEPDLDDTLRTLPRARAPLWPWVAAAGAVVLVGVGAYGLMGGDDDTRTIRAVIDAGVKPEVMPPRLDDLPIEPLRSVDAGEVPVEEVASDAGAPSTPTPPSPGERDSYPVTFGSTPAGAQVWIRMDKRVRLLCTTPCEFTLPAGKQVLVELRMDGHASAQRTLTVADGARFHGKLRPK